MVPQTAYQGADVAPEPDHRRDSGLAQESRWQYSNARGHRDAQISSIDDLKSVLLQGLRTGVFDDLIREALPTDPKEREALRRHLLKHLLMCVVRCAYSGFRKKVYGSACRFTPTSEEDGVIHTLL